MACRCQGRTSRRHCLQSRHNAGTNGHAPLGKACNCCLFRACGNGRRGRLRCCAGGPRRPHQSAARLPDHSHLQLSAGAAPIAAACRATAAARAGSCARPARGWGRRLPQAGLHAGAASARRRAGSARPRKQRHHRSEARNVAIAAPMVTSVAALSGWPMALPTAATTPVQNSAGTSATISQAETAGSPHRCPQRVSARSFAVFFMRRALRTTSTLGHARPAR